MEMMSTFTAFILGGFFFWPIIIGFALLSVVLVRKKHEFWSMLFFGILVFLLFQRWEPLQELLKPWNVAGFELGNIAKLILYAIAGVVWSLVYWVLLNRHNSQVFQHIKQSVLRDYVVPANAFTLEYQEYLATTHANWLVTNKLTFEDVAKLTSGMAKMAIPVDLEVWARATQALGQRIKNGGDFQRVYPRGHLPQELLESIKPKASNLSSTIAVWIIYWPFSIVWFLVRDFTVQFATFVYNNLGRTFQRITNRIFKDSL
jgi:hypothetical protein